MTPLKHKCPVRVCQESVHITRLMCPDHWAMVPKPLQLDVYREYKKDKLSREHVAAMDAAIAAVDDQLGRAR